MTKKKTWAVPVIKGTNIAWTEIWNSYDVELDKCAPEDYKFGATIKFAGIGRGYGSGAKVFVKDTERTYINNKGKSCFAPNFIPSPKDEHDDFLTKLKNTAVTNNDDCESSEKSEVNENK